MAMFDTSMTALHGWHPGELAIQSALNVTSAVQFSYTGVRDHMPDQHRIFHTSNVAFVPIAVLDSEDRPWVSLIPWRVSSPSEVELRIQAEVWEGDPIRHVRSGSLVAGLGIEWATRRRNKFAGRVSEISRDGTQIGVGLKVTQTLGNCPKYITVRTVAPAPASPRLVYNVLTISDDGRLPDEIVDFIHRCDTVFLGTSYVARPDDAALFPSHLGVNHRGGRTGFVRVRKDGRTIVLPDYSGNRFMQSLGNVHATPLAGVTILDFESGDLLYLTGTAQNLFGQDAEKVLPRSNLITLISTTGYTFVRNAMPIRQVPGSPKIPSPYSPPVRYLAEEKSTGSSSTDVTLTLSRIQIHSHDLATFSFIPSSPVTIKPGQAAIIDTSSFTGRRAYKHMATQGAEASLNDDGIRTWTVSGHTDNLIAITMREKPGGFVTPRLFHIARMMAESMPSLLQDASPLNLVLPLVGIDGEFVLDEARRVLWVAGGVGITPFLSMLKGVRGDLDIVLVVAARRTDVEVLVGLVADALQNTGPALSLRVIVYSEGYRDDGQLGLGLHPAQVVIRNRRLAAGEFVASEVDAAGREVYICGPLTMEEVAVHGVRAAGVDSEHIHRENFAY